jgi:hypothetical protein
MLGLELFRERAVLVAEPDGPLTEADFDRMAALLDPFLDEAGRLRGLLVDTSAFPGWDGLGALLAHERFIHAHQGRLERIALVTDSLVANAIAHLAEFAVAPEVRHFSSGERHAAMDWLAAAA